MKKLRTLNPLSLFASRRGFLSRSKALLLFSILATLYLPLLPGELGAQGTGSSSVGRDLLLANAQKFLAHKAKIKPGETVLLVGDRSADPLVREVFIEAAQKAGGVVHQIIFQGKPELTDGFEIARQMRFQTWFPEWVWKPAAEVDVLLEMTNLGGSHQRGIRPKLPARVRSVGIPFARREQLADPRAIGNYPEEIVEAITEAVWRQIMGKRQMQVTDVEGTDLKWTVDVAAWDEVKGNEHITLALPYRKPKPDMQGWLVGSSTHSGPFPTLRLRVQDGRVVEVQGGQHVGDALRKVMAEYKDIQYPGFPGPGATWIEETAVGPHPGRHRVPGAETFGWWAGMTSWGGAARAGVFHFAVGTSGSGKNYQFAREHKLEIQHLDIELYEPTVIMDGQTIVRQGHLLALDDPEVRKVASKYGNPEELLRVTWSPKGK